MKLVFKRDAMYDVRQQPKVRADLLARAEAVAAACGGEEAGYATSSTQGAKKPQGRWRAAVYTMTFDAILDNARNNTLVRRFGSARG
ncbi:hypothetical protein ACFPPE_07355 [Agromyces tardus]|uniref:hypothetical protein n=1 Tax=Agromyces tardus TaxID=2583849 RepID=UPI0036104B6F